MLNTIRELVKCPMPLQISHPWDDNIKSTGIKDVWFIAITLGLRLYQTSLDCVLGEVKH